MNLEERKNKEWRLEIKYANNKCIIIFIKY